MSDEGGLTGLSSEARALLSDPPGYILGMFVTAIFGFVGAAVGLLLDIQAMLFGSLAQAGDAVASDLRTVALVVLDTLTLPIRLTGDMVAGAGVFAPILSALVFAVTVFVVAGLLWGLFRVIRFI